MGSMERDLATSERPGLSFMPVDELHMEHRPLVVRNVAFVKVWTLNLEAVG